MSEEWVSEEEVKEEIEGLPEEVRELEVGEKGRRPEERPAQVQPPPQPPPQPTPPQPSYEDVLQELRRRRELVREVVEFAREVSSLSPQEVSVATKLLDRVLPPQTPQQPQLSPPREEVRYVERQVPVPVTSPELQRELRETREYVASALEGVERRLAYYDEVLRRYDQILARLSEVTTSVTSITGEIARLRQEVENVRRERDELLRKFTEHYEVLPRARVTTPDGKVVEEYDFHPRLRAYEKQVDFVTQQLTPAIFARIDRLEANLLSVLNRGISLVESVVAPELRRRAPRIVEDIEERFRRLVGRLTPEERVRELEELGRRVEELSREVEGR